MTTEESRVGLLPEEITDAIDALRKTSIRLGEDDGHSGNGMHFRQEVEKAEYALREAIRDALTESSEG